MKKSTHQTSKHRKLVLRREAIVMLIPPQLSNAIGGDVAISTTNCITQSAEIDNCTHL
jgi:hypothetical protein